MAKIGTAVLEIKPVLNEEALQAIADLIEEAVSAGIARGLAKRNTYQVYVGDPLFPNGVYNPGRLTSGSVGQPTSVTWTAWNAPGMENPHADREG